MEICIAKFDETDDWVDEELKRLAGRIFTVYLYNPKLHVHCCEFTPSHELHFLGFVMQGTPELDALDEDARESTFEKLYEGLRAMNGYEVSYVWVRDVERLSLLKSPADAAPGRASFGSFTADGESADPREWTQEQMDEALEAARESAVGNGYVDIS